MKTYKILKPKFDWIRMKKCKNVLENQKVRNANSIIINDKVFKSQIEGYVYLRLQDLGIKAEYETTRFTLMYPFEYQGEKIRAMTYRPDFVGESFIIECKGFKTDAWKVREKLAKRRLAKDFPHLKYYVVSSMIGFENIVDELMGYKNE